MKDFCFRCGECCQKLFNGMLMTYQEHKLIYKMTGTFVPYKIAGKGRGVIQSASRCPFLQEKLCRFYDIRPCQCRMYHCGRLAPSDETAPTIPEVRLNMESNSEYRDYKIKTEKAAVAWGNAHGWNWRKVC